MILTQNFKLSEFDCHDGTPVPLDKVDNIKRLAENLQIIRDAIYDSLSNTSGVPFTDQYKNQNSQLKIVSGYRTPAWNKKVGGVASSMHKEGKASDLWNKCLTPRQLHALIEKLIKQGKILDGGLSLYPTFVHYDIGKVRRWFYNK